MENKQSFYTDSLAVAAVGTAQQFDDHRIVQGHYATVHACPANTGNIYVGESQAQAQAHNFTLTPDASHQIATDNSSDIWIDAAVEGEIAELSFEIDNADV